MGVSESSVKRWCDSGTISSEKTSGGHRKITLEALQSFLDSTQRKLEFPEKLGMPRMLPSRSVSLAGSDEPRKQIFRNALATGQEDRCRQLMREMVDQGASCSQAAECLITDAMSSMGLAWNCQQIDIYQERRACDIASKLIYELRQSLPALPLDAPIAIGGSPEGDHYQLPTALVELTLREAGWNATNLGSHLPLNSFRQAAADYSAELVWISVSAIDEVDTFVRDQNEMAASLSGEIALLMGGRALCDSVRPRLRYTAYCDSLRHLVDLATIIRSKRSSTTSS